MLILHDPKTLSHSTIELLGSKLIPALESPSRVTSILSSLQASSHQILTIAVPPEDSQGHADLLSILSTTHDTGYLTHLRTTHARWVEQGLIEKDGSVLPECFPFSHSARKGPPTLPTKPPVDIFACPGFYAFDLSTGIASGTWESALASANLAIEGVRLLLDGSSTALSTSSTVASVIETSNQAPSTTSTSPTPRTIFALTRPPGHHCDTRRAGGYCYINNAVVAVSAIRRATPSSAPRIAIIDLDFHHGNGTQETFYADQSILYTSIHGQDEYPYYTGSRDETGTGEGEGFNINIPLRTGSSAAEYLAALDKLLAAVQKFAPEFVLVSLGFDTFRLDPIGKFELDVEDYEDMGRRVSKVLGGLDEIVAQEEAKGEEDVKGNSATVPSLILLEGGYVIEKLGSCAVSFLKGWEGADHSSGKATE